MYQTYRIIVLSLACCLTSSCSGSAAGFKEKKEFDSRHSLYPIIENATSYRAFHGQRGFVQGNSLLVRVEINDPKQFIAQTFNLKLEDYNSKDAEMIDLILKDHYELNNYLREKSQSWIPDSFVADALYYGELPKDSLSFVLGKAGANDQKQTYYIFFEK